MPELSPLGSSHEGVCKGAEKVNCTGLAGLLKKGSRVKARDPQVREKVGSRVARGAKTLRCYEQAEEAIEMAG